jgi:hypothetical protein
LGGEDEADPGTLPTLRFLLVGLDLACQTRTVTPIVLI